MNREVMQENVFTEEEQNTDFEIRSLDTICINESELEHKWYHNIKYFAVGVLFGIVLVKGEVIPGFAYRKCFACKAFICMV